MDKKITLSGFAGSGKSTVGQELSRILNFEFISVGNYSRDFAKKEFGLSINEFQEKCKNDPKIDSLIDEHFQKYCNEKNNLIIDYRLGFKFIKNSFNVLLKVSNETACNRIREAKRLNEEIDSFKINERNELMRKRFIEIYGVDFADENNYHLVVNTDNLNINEIVNLIMLEFNKR